MSTTPRVSSGVPGEPADFYRALAHQPALSARFAATYAAFWQSGVLSQRVKEVVRLRNARITDCGL
jgi:alkylhydroperoxidase family enzyme